MKAVWEGVILAASDETIVVEGNHYFPPKSIRWDRLLPSTTRTRCFWKGIATYYTVAGDRERGTDFAWTYRRPYPWIAKIRNHVAFSREVDVRP